ncbi:MAG: succinyl-diaminopimelate desuccinylase [Gammaproteobacteria bacterium]
MSQLLQLVRDLISRPSVTPEDSGCQDVMRSRLEAIGFSCETIEAGGVTNLFATRGQQAPLFCFAGHTDVVPTGPEEQWSSQPFAPEIRDGKLYGRGAADMKGSLAAMICATEAFVEAHPEHPGTVAFLITSDEEGPAKYGTREVMRVLKERGIRIDHCLVGEPSSSKQLGDVVRVGRRGSLHAQFTIRGVQGHVAYPEIALNPIHAAAPLITTLNDEVWDEGNPSFPPTSFQISNIHSGTGANNVIPGELEFTANFRYSTAVTEQSLKARCERIIEEVGVDAVIDWNLSGEPFLSEHGALTKAVATAIKQLSDIDTDLSTGGGTSDGRFIAPSGAEVVELGPINASIHQIDEHVDVDDLEHLVKLYEHILGGVLIP